MDVSVTQVMKIEIGTTKYIRKTETRKVPGTELTLHASIRPIVYVLRFFGHAPYELDDDNLLVPSSSYLVFSYSWISIYTYCAYKVLSDMVTSPWNTETVSTFVGISAVVFNYIGAVFDLLLSLVTRKTFANIWNAIEDFDESVKDICWIRNERETWIWVWSVIIFNFIMWLLINQAGMYAFGETWIRNISYMIIYVGPALAVIKFSGIVMMLYQRFHHLNLIAMKSMPNGQSWMKTRSLLDVAFIERLHDNLMRIGDRFESIYTWSIMIWLGNLSLHVVICFHGALMALMSTSLELPRFNCTMSWITIFIWQLWLITSACHYASTEAQNMGYIMLEWKRKLYNQHGNLNLASSLHTNIWTHRELIFTAAGCFNVNLPLLRSIVSLITTLLVILLQMK